ncbi:MAG: exodeoxyribonuclease VII small subunit [Planctomycetes bacterium]|nr:exodeoxyribonuclease VII small subunit [Planctomycetota bacterium]
MEKAPRKEKFEDLLRQVEEAVKALESGKLGLEESLERYEAGMKALKQCHVILEQAEKKIQILVKEKDGTLAEKELKPESKEPKREKGLPRANPPEAGESRGAELPF